MADLNTKQRILNASIQLFNENGLANVRLQQIASTAGISVGNLAYHFRNREVLLDTIMEDINQDLASILSTYRVLPNLIDFDMQLSKYFEFLQKYPFYSKDLSEIERTCPGSREKRHQLFFKMIHQIRKRFEFNQDRGLIIPEARSGLYDTIAHSIWVLITLWPLQNFVQGNAESIDADHFKAMIWNQVYPYLSEKGRAEFNQLILPLLNQNSI